MSLMIWNCRGVGNNEFRRVMSTLFRDFRLKVLVLLETKVSFKGMGDFFVNLGLRSSIHVVPVPRTRGIWLLYNTHTVTVM